MYILLLFFYINIFLVVLKILEININVMKIYINNFISN